MIYEATYKVVHILYKAKLRGHWRGSISVQLHIHQIQTLTGSESHA